MKEDTTERRSVCVAWVTGKLFLPSNGSTVSSACFPVALLGMRFLLHKGNWISFKRSDSLQVSALRRQGTSMETRLFPLIIG
ncbi:hypothetical protein X798_03297 [Onchocerca flexuosa]|uniref:Uncharacterized protein n=2 Tax=Onchocerca flexuosa TaxID=387005 RepID=A0A183I092_9BILA|nr:hypothetical protein X798_03297 [Onchocerca flexuosa]VDP13035.1 unnamed protein product [Onchocerca flexuosa]